MGLWTHTTCIEHDDVPALARAGIALCPDDPFAWHGERLSEETFEAGFRLHPFQDVIADAELADDVAARLARRFGGANAAFCDNVVSVTTLISHTPLEATGGTTLYFRWRGPSRQR